MTGGLLLGELRFRENCCCYCCGTAGQPGYRNKHSLTKRRGATEEKKGPSAKQMKKKKKKTNLRRTLVY